MNIEGKTDKQLQQMCIRKWKSKLKLTAVDIRGGKNSTGEDNCPFCWKYNHYPKPYCCEGCPIKKQTGSPYCRDTPHRVVARLYDEIMHYEHRKIKEFHKTVQKEIDFLESLEC